MKTDNAGWDAWHREDDGRSSVRTQAGAREYLKGYLYQPAKSSS